MNKHDLEEIILITSNWIKRISINPQLTEQEILSASMHFEKIKVMGYEIKIEPKINDNYKGYDLVFYYKGKRIPHSDYSDIEEPKHIRGYN